MTLRLLQASACQGLSQAPACPGLAQAQALPGCSLTQALPGPQQALASQGQPGTGTAKTSQAPATASLHLASARLAAAGLAGLLLLCPCASPAIPLPASDDLQIQRARGARDAELGQSPFLPGSVPGRVAVVRRMNASAAARCLGLARDFYRWNELKPSARLLPGCELWLDDPCLLAQASPRLGTSLRPGLAAGLAADSGKGQEALPACGATARWAGQDEAPATTAGTATGIAASQAGKARARPEKRQESRRTPAKPDRLERPEKSEKPGRQAKPSARPSTRSGTSPGRSGAASSGLAMAAPSSAPAVAGQPAGDLGLYAAVHPADGSAASGTPLAAGKVATPGPCPASLKDGSSGVLLALKPGSCSAQLAHYLGELGWQLAWRLSRDIWIAAHATYPGAPADALKRLFKDLARAGQPCRVTVYTANHVIEVRED
ncbi:MAG: toxin co-regulated pilus biosynthesis Q family protein [Desulfovibrio sp.]|nr:toxin co-regulated pilus biosynthesis Q family protein [Desulfovibrio sp.]